MRTKLLRKLALAVVAAKTITVATSCACSQDDKQEEKKTPKLNSIEINLKDKYVELYINESTTTQPITINCKDQDGKKIESEVKLELSSESSNVPEWISINNQNCIEINQPQNVGTYKFNVTGYSKDKTIHSKVQELLVEVKAIPIVAPDKIELFATAKVHTVMTTQSYSIPIVSTVTRTGVDPQYVDQNLKWSIQYRTESKQIDKEGNPLFSIKQENGEDNCVISQNIDEQYVGEYNLTITATSTVDESVSGSIDFQITVQDGLHYVVTTEDGDYKYKRSNVYEGWTLYSVPVGNVIKVSGQSFLGNYVTAVDDNLCANCGITELVILQLQPSITKVGKRAFYNQTALYQINAIGLKDVGDEAFAGCNGMRFIYSPTLANVGYRAFYGCSSMTNSAKNDLVSLSEEAFAGSGITTFYFGKKIKKIPDKAFADCSKLETITITNPEPPEISGNPFSGTILNKIQVPSSALQAYQTHQYWSIYSEYLEGI